MSIQEKITEIRETLETIEASAASAREAHPNADEAILAAMDAGQKALDAVRTLLHKIG